MKRVRLQLCTDADADNARDPRNIAHVGHVPGRICLARAFFQLPEGFRLGVVLHELGHLTWISGDHDEKDADKAGGMLAGVTIHRRAWRSARMLEFIAPDERSRALRVVRRMTNY